MGKFSRDKGYRVENNLRKQALMHDDIECFRVPLSGGASIKGDLVVNKTGEEKWILEAKCRANGFKSIYDWFEDSEFSNGRFSHLSRTINCGLTGYICSGRRLGTTGLVGDWSVVRGIGCANKT